MSGSGFAGLFPVQDGGKVRMLFEVIAEVGGFGEAQLPGDLLDRDGRVLEEGFGFGDGLVGDPGAYGFAGFTFDDITKVVRVQVLDGGVVLDAEDFFFGSLHQVPVVLFECLFEGFDDLGGAVALINRVVFRPEVFFYFQ